MDPVLSSAIISALSVLIIGLLSYYHNRQTLTEQRISERRKTIAKKLNEFYGPFASYLNITKALFNIFSANKPEGFRTLEYLLDRNQLYVINGQEVNIKLTETDKHILEEILEIEQKIENLIIEKAGLIDDEILMFDYLPDPNKTDVSIEKLSLLAIAVTHFRVLRLAYSGHFQGEVKRFKSFVYPKELDSTVKTRINALEKELDNPSIKLKKS